jgi:hypothetical protein
VECIFFFTFYMSIVTRLIFLSDRFAKSSFKFIYNFFSPMATAVTQKVGNLLRQCGDDHIL